MAHRVLSRQLLSRRAGLFDKVRSVPLSFQRSFSFSESWEDYGPGGLPHVYLGQTYDHYKVVAKLGHGSTSTVWAAHDLRSPNRMVALKFLKSSSTSAGTAIREAQILEYIRSRPGIDRTYLLKSDGHFSIQGPDGAHGVLVSEVAGPSLEEVCPIPLKLVKKLSHQILGAVASLHTASVVHGDLKMDNIVLDVGTASTRDYEFLTNLNLFYDQVVKNPGVAFGPMCISYDNSYLLAARDSVHEPLNFRWNAKIVDFGSSFYENEFHAPRTSEREHQAPENIFFERSGFDPDPCRDRRMDIWSLGYLMYRMAGSGRLLWETGRRSKDPNWKLIADWVDIFGPLPERWRPHWDPNGKAVTRNKSDRSLQERIRKYSSIKDEGFIDLLTQMLVFEPADRKSATELLQHPFFADVDEHAGDGEPVQRPWLPR